MQPIHNRMGLVLARNLGSGRVTIFRLYDCCRFTWDTSADSAWIGKFYKKTRESAFATYHKADTHYHWILLTSFRFYTNLLRNATKN